MKKEIIGFIILVLLIIPLLFAIPWGSGIFTEAHGIAFDSTSGALPGADAWGFKVLVLKNATLTNITKSNVATVTHCQVEAVGGSLLASGTYVGNICNVNYDFVAGTSYWVRGNSTGTHIVHSKTGVTYPIAGANGIINYTAGVSQVEVEEPTNAYDIRNLTFVIPGTITLNSPEDNYISSTNEVGLNCSATITSGETITNMSSWKNDSGGWHRNQTVDLIATPTHETLGLTLDTPATWSAKQGAKFNITQSNGRKIFGFNITLSGGDQPDECYLLNSDKTTNITGTLTGAECVLGSGLNLNYGDTFYLAVDQGGDSFSSIYAGALSYGTYTGFEILNGYEAIDRATNTMYAINGVNSGVELTTATITFNTTITDSTLWTCEAGASDGTSDFATENRTVNADSTPPVIDILYPDGQTFTLDFFSPVYPIIDLNWSINDSSLDSCWYRYGSTNTTVNCADNATTFQTAAQINLTMYSNDTVGNLNSSTTFWNYNYTITNITTSDTTCLDQEINWTNLPDGNYTFNTTVWVNDSTTSASNSTEIRTVYIDTTFPLIDYASNSEVNNKSADFGVKDNIFVNVSVTEINEQNITFVLYTSLGIINQTNYTDSTRTINWTGLSEDMYFWNVTVCDKANNCNNTVERYYGAEKVNESVDLQFSDINAELGGDILVNATSNFGIVCVDIDHPEYGINYSCVDFSNVFNLTIDYFRKINFANESHNWTLNYTGQENQTMNITMHQYDEIDNLTVNISGSENSGFPYNTLFYGLNNSIIDRFFPGYLRGNEIFLNQTSEGVDSINLTYSNRGNQTINFWMDDNADLRNFTFNLSADSYGTDYYNNYSITFDEAESETNTILLGSYILSKGINLMEFIVDDFEDSVINTAKWIISIANGNYDGFGVSYSLTINNKEENGYFEMAIENYNEDFTGTNSGTRVVNNEMYANFTQLNSWTPKNILFEASYVNTLEDEGDSYNQCTAYHEIKLGGVEVWKSNESDVCRNHDGNDQGCTTTRTTIQNLTFNLTRQKNNSWFVKIGGVEQATGLAKYPGSIDCGSFTATYNYTSGFWNRTFTLHPGSTLCDNVGGNLDPYYIKNLDWDLIAQFYSNSHVDGFWDNDDADGCQTIQSSIKFYYINQTLYDLSNGVFTSESIFDAGGDIASATLDASGLDTHGIAETFSYMSANNGIDWEGVTEGVEHSFVNPGTNLRYKFEMNLTETGYLNNTYMIYEVNITSPKGNPENITFDFGNDGIVDYSIPGEFNATNGTITVDLSLANLTTEFLRSSEAGYEHLHAVPLKIGTSSIGQLNFEVFNLTYNPNPVSLNVTWVQTYLNNISGGFNNISFNVESTNGTINLTDLRLDYAGGNDTIEVKAHNTDYTKNVSRNITYFYSRWDYEWGPSAVDWLVFLPTSTTDTNVTPYGQSSSIPIWNLTNYGYGGKDTNLSIYVNETLDCVNITMSLTNNKSQGNIVNDSWLELNSSITYLQNTDIYLWADFSCDYSTWHLFDPYFYFRQCAEDSTCSEEF